MPTSLAPSKVTNGAIVSSPGSNQGQKEGREGMKEGREGMKELKGRNEGVEGKKCRS
jgi:hypothetical protein